MSQSGSRQVPDFVVTTTDGRQVAYDSLWQRKNLLLDRWGEIAWQTSADPARLPGPDEVIDWLCFVQRQCPECEGEAR